MAFERLGWRCACSGSVPGGVRRGYDMLFLSKGGGQRRKFVFSDGVLGIVVRYIDK